MKRNFSIRAFAQILISDAVIDIHNCYRTTSITTEIDGTIARVIFHLNKEFESSPNLPETFTFTCSGNVLVLINDLVGWPIAIADDTIEVAYYDADCHWDQFLDEELAKKCRISGLHFSFASGLVLRLRCDEAQVSVA